MKNTKILVALLIPLLLISLGTYFYAHFTDTVTKKYKLHVRCFLVEVKSYKAVSRYDDDLIQKYPSDDELEAMGGTTTLSLTTDKAFVPGWYVWVGLLIQNQGSFPANVTTPQYDISGTTGVGVYTEEYFYGPYTHGDFASHSEVWGKVRWKDLEAYGAPPGDVPPPVLLEPAGDAYKSKMVLWIYLELIDLNGPTEYFTVHIEITVNTTAVPP